MLAGPGETDVCSRGGGLGPLVKRGKMPSTPLGIPASAQSPRYASICSAAAGAGANQQARSLHGVCSDGIFSVQYQFVNSTPSWTAISIQR